MKSGEHMAHSFTGIYLHIIFSTKNRTRMLSPELRDRLFPYMGGLIRERNGDALLINGVEDHIHILTRFPATITLSDFLRDVKSISAGWVRDVFRDAGQFGWQTGYAAFSVSKTNVDTVREYIAQQEEHHKRKTFEEEYLEFLQRAGIEYDPRFVLEKEITG
jgi:putative transposase